jgi:hypothetical protein
MATKRDIVRKALGYIGLATYIFDATADELTDALTELDNLAAEWDGIGVRVGYMLPGTGSSDLDDEAGIPDTSVSAFALNLAPRIAPSYGKLVSPQVLAMAKASYNALLVARAKIPEVQYPNTFPYGRGNRRDTKDPAYYTPEDQITTNNDGILEF